MKEEVSRLQAFAAAGVTLIERWAPAGQLDQTEQGILGAMGASLFASYISSKSGLQAKRAAIAMALRAAYLYGRLGGVFPDANTDNEHTEQNTGD